MKAAILGKKKGMTSYFTEYGSHVPVTVVEAGPCPVVQVKTSETDGYSSVQIGYDEKPKQSVIKPESGHFDKAGVKSTYVLKEFRDPEMEVKVGQSFTVEQFEIGDIVKVSGVSKGKGFQGVVKRHHFAGVGDATHGQSDQQRHGGSVGQSSDSSRIFKGMKMPGRLGGDRVTETNLRVVDVIPEENIILIKGSVPGGRNAYLEIYK